MITVTLVWYFLMGQYVVGPFNTQADCEKIRKDAPARHFYTSSCWQGPMGGLK